MKGETTPRRVRKLFIKLEEQLWCDVDESAGRDEIPVVAQFTM
jgi:hypothetical protein